MTNSQIEAKAKKMILANSELYEMKAMISHIANHRSVKSPDLDMDEGAYMDSCDSGKEVQWAIDELEWLIEEGGS